MAVMSLSEGTVTILHLLDDLTDDVLLFTKRDIEIQKKGKRNIKRCKKRFYPLLYCTEEMPEMVLRKVLLELETIPLRQYD